MEIYIRTRSLDSGRTAWWNHENGESYLLDSPTLFAKSKYSGDTFMAGTPFRSANEAMREAKKAKKQAEYDGDVDVEVTFWRFKGNELIGTKFTRDGKIVK